MMRTFGILEVVVCVDDCVESASASERRVSKAIERGVDRTLEIGILV